MGADATDTTWQFMHRTAAGTTVKSSTGITKSAADRTEIYELTITVLPGATTAYMTFKRITGAGATGTQIGYTTTTAIAASTTALAMRLQSSVGATSSVIGIGLARFYLESDT